MATALNTIYLLCLIDSSLTVLTAWSRISPYLQQCLQRLGQGGSESRLQIAFVTYATADTVPSPILAKLPFVDAHYIRQDWKNNDFSKLALGQIAVTKNMRTSTLEGLVAALELFDSIPPRGPSAAAVHRILHISATTADDNKHPHWNISTTFDQTTWQTLPAELKKRNIVISGICLQENPTLLEFYKSVSGDSPQQPWFPVQSGHQVSLYGFPPPSSRPPKRVTDTQNSPDAKRVKTADTPTSSNASTSGSPVKGSTPAKENEATQLGLNPGSHNFAQRAHSLMNQLKVVTSMISRVETEIRTAKSQGQMEKAAKLELEHLKLKDRQAIIMRPLNQLKAQLVSQHASGAAEASSSSSTPATAPTAETSTTNIASQARQRPPSLNLTPQEIAISPAKPIPVSSHVNLTAPKNSPPSEALASQSPNLAAQMQKIMQQQTQARAGGSVPSVHQDPMAAAQAFPVPTPLNVQSKPPLWQGAMIFTGPDPTNVLGKEIMIPMRAHCASPSAEYHPETWPQRIKLVATNKVLNSPSDLAPWIKKYNPLMCTLLPQDAENKVFRMLFTYLQNKKTYATGGWTLPSGTQKTNLLVFSFSEGLIGAFFPHIGVPEFSHMDLTPIVAQNTHPIPPQILAKLNSLPPDQRERFLQFQLHAHQQQLAATASTMANQPGFTGGAVSMEMLQSFIQRKPPGAG